MRADPVVRVQFYHGEVLLGTAQDPGEDWSLTVDTTGWDPGEHTFEARAQDNHGAWSELQRTDVTIVAVLSWQNPVSRFDVNGDGIVEPMDALVLINEINRDGTRDLPPRTADDLHLPFFDVSGDGRLDALDVLLVINEINRRSAGHIVPDSIAEGEESVNRAFGGQVLPPVVLEVGDRTQAWRGGDADDARPVVDPVPAAAVGRMFERPELIEREWETPDWETLLDDPALEYADLDAYFAELD